MNAKQEKKTQKKTLILVIERLRRGNAFNIVGLNSRATTACVRVASLTCLKKDMCTVTQTKEITKHASRLSR